MRYSIRTRRNTATTVGPRFINERRAPKWKRILADIQRQVPKHVSPRTDGAPESTSAARLARSDPRKVGADLRNDGRRLPRHDQTGRLMTIESDSGVSAPSYVRFSPHVARLRAIAGRTLIGREARGSRGHVPPSAGVSEAVFPSLLPDDLEAYAASPTCRPDRPPGALSEPPIICASRRAEADSDQAWSEPRRQTPAHPPSWLPRRASRAQAAQTKQEVSSARGWVIQTLLRRRRVHPDTRGTEPEFLSGAAVAIEGRAPR